MASKTGIKPRIGMRIWLTAMFVMVTAFAAIVAYETVRPILKDTLDRASQARFEEVAQQFENEIEKNQNFSLERIRTFADIRGLQWGIVSAKSGTKLRGDRDLDEWHQGVVQNAVKTQSPKMKIEPVRSGRRTGQIRATYAVPINAEAELGVDGTAVVFSEFFTESDIENVQKALESIQRIALLAGALALALAGVAGYLAASLISRRISRLGVAAERLAAGNFDERIETRVEDEVGSLGATFNTMAASLKGAFEQIRHEKERGSAILNGMTDAVVGVDKDLNAVFLNPRARELLESSDLDFQIRLQEVLAKTRYSGPITEPEAMAGDRIIEIRAAPLEDGALAILRDVTEERRVQRAKAEFIANASHELKTPLTALSGYLEMLEDEEDERVRYEFLKDMRSQTDRLQSLARTLLDLSRLDANATTFRTEEVDLEDILHELRRDFGYTGRPMSIYADDVPPVVTDPTQLHRMLAILLDNALKYSSEDTPIDLNLSRNDGHAVISVTDRGCGIPESEIPHIFDRFYRAQGSSRADGTGLGLALAREIMDHLGGNIQVQSYPGAGSTFSVALPLTADSRDGSRSSSLS
ncbi:MAG TPA: ATP-binding protein [Rubrobacteraceae bacterium]|nr:ATP-binding protein [Rubrobacteraceae bacterium]